MLGNLLVHLTDNKGGTYCGLKLEDGGRAVTSFELGKVTCPKCKDLYDTPITPNPGDKLD